MMTRKLCPGFLGLAALATLVALVTADRGYG